MKRYKLNAVVRTGKGRQLRREKQVPAVLYGRGMEAVHLALPEADIKYFVHHGSANALIDLAVGSESHTVMIRELQRNRIKGEVLHVDFYAVDLLEKLTTSVPIHLQGESDGVRAGGVLQYQLREIEVSCLPTEIPSSFDLNISDMGIGDSKTVADLTIPGGIEILTPETDVVVSIQAPRLEEETQTTETEEVAPEQGQEPDTE
jgi:large subunit ribosomal protein L25